MLLLQCSTIPVKKLTLNVQDYRYTTMHAELIQGNKLFLVQFTKLENNSLMIMKNTNSNFNQILKIKVNSNFFFLFELKNQIF